MCAETHANLAAPERFALWLAKNQELSKADNRLYNYLPRSASDSPAQTDRSDKNGIERGHYEAQSGDFEWSGDSDDDRRFRVL
jgi:hypothetical protein